MRVGTRVALVLFLLCAAVVAGGVVWSPASDCTSGYHLGVERASPASTASADARSYDSLPDPAKSAFRAGLRGVPLTERDPLARTYGLGGALVRYEGDTYRVEVLVRDCRYVYPHVVDRVATFGAAVLAVFVGTVWAFWRFAFVPATEGPTRRRPRE